MEILKAPLIYWPAVQRGQKSFPSGFTVSREGIGSIHFLEPIEVNCEEDLKKIELDIGFVGIGGAASCENTPPGLNKRARVDLIVPESISRDKITENLNAMTGVA